MIYVYRFSRTAKLVPSRYYIRSIQEAPTRSIITLSWLCWYRPKGGRCIKCDHIWRRGCRWLIVGNRTRTWLSLVLSSVFGGSIKVMCFKRLGKYEKDPEYEDFDFNSKKTFHKGSVSLKCTDLGNLAFECKPRRYKTHSQRLL